MRDAALLALLFALAYAGFLLFALSQPRHWNGIVGTIAERKPRRLRWAGGLMVVLSLGMTLYRDGPAFGAILWTVVLIVAAVASVATLTWQTPLLRRMIARMSSFKGRSAPPAPTYSGDRPTRTG